LHFFTHSPIPGLKGITEAIVRRTFFAQFVPGENVGECTPKMEELRERNIGAVLNYSAEAECETKDDARRLQQARLKEVYHALEGAGEFEDRVAAKGGLRGSTAFALKVVRTWMAALHLTIADSSPL
jgi:proline dehydrogenase